MAFDMDDLNNLDMDSLGDLPFIAKAVIIGLICAGILFAGYWFLSKPQLEKLEKEQKKQQELRLSFESRQRRAANLDAYLKQIEEIEETFGTLLRKLPDKTEVPGLLEDISTAGITSGLQFNVFKPLPERELSFYAELPIEISVTGSYHQLAEFISKVSALDRIVTVHDFTIAYAQPKQNEAVNPNRLEMRLIAKTYRYKEEGDVQ